jgi:hypothetical protein
MRYHLLNKLSSPTWYLLSLAVYGLAVYILGHTAGILPNEAGNTNERLVTLSLILLPLSFFLAVTWYQRLHTNCHVYEWEYWVKLLWAQRYLLFGFLVGYTLIYTKITFF